MTFLVGFVFFPSENCLTFSPLSRRFPGQKSEIKQSVQTAALNKAFMASPQEQGAPRIPAPPRDSCQQIKTKETNSLNSGRICFSLVVCDL